MSLTKGMNYELERTKVATALSRIDPARLSFMQAKEIKRELNSPLGCGTIRKIRNQIYKAREGMMARKTKEGKVEQIGQAIVLERIANVISKSYVHLGDNEKVASEDALTMIKRHLQAYDPSIIKRNEKRALPKTAPVRQ